MNKFHFFAVWSLRT